MVKGRDNKKIWKKKIKKTGKSGGQELLLFHVTVPGATTSSSHWDTLWNLKTEKGCVVKWHNKTKQKGENQEKRKIIYQLVLRAVIPHECARNENEWGNVKIV